jgi:signal transduction histidine kinase
MSARVGVRHRTLPIRRWLAVAVVVSFIIPVIVTGTVAFAYVRLPQIERFHAGDELKADVNQWRDADWQARTSADLRKSGIEFVLLEDGQEIYRSTPDPLDAHTDWQDARIVQRYDINSAGTQRTAYVYANLYPNGQNRYWMLPIVGISILLATLAGIAWFLKRTITKPLAATSAAAQQVAAGDLDIALPSSRVREVAELNAAFESMSAELRASLEHRAELEQERRMFISAVVHDLRTPLFSLRGSLEGLQAGIADTPEKRERYIAVAQEKADALERLISDLFDFTRLEYLDQTPNREPLDLGALMRRLVDGLQPQSEAKEIQVVLDTGDAPCSVDADPHLLTRAVENLLDNALRYTPNGGQIRVACDTDSEVVHFTVADTGPGIPAHDLPHLFTPLYRGETSRNRRTGGAGLGLTIARRILQAHQGDLTAANGPDGGAVFTATLPGRGNRQ